MGGGGMTIGSQIVLLEPVVIVEDTRTVYIPRGAMGTVAALEDGQLTISLNGEDYAGIPTESVKERGRPYAGA